MTKIDFYVSQKSDLVDRLTLAAKLCEKAIRNQMKVLVVLDNSEDLSKLDELLWAFRSESFIPHSLVGQNSPLDPVVMSLGEDEANHHDFLINLGGQVPPMFSRFQRLAEIVVQSSEALASTRAHFSFYKSRGYPVTTHKIA